MKKIRKVAYQFIKYDGIPTVIAVAVILVLILLQRSKKEPIEIVDWTIFSSIVVASILNNFSKRISFFWMNKLEDSSKLTQDYLELTTKYKNNMITYDNSFASQENQKKMKEGDKGEICIPVICEHKLRGCAIEIEDSITRYKLPEIVYAHFDELFEAHATSEVYNQLTIRVDDWKCEKSVFTMKTSRTTFFDSLVTNRAMDFQWDNKMTIREQFEMGPYLQNLKDSSLSNHIGFNGFVESLDGYFIFVKQRKEQSIGKRTYGNSVGAILKTKYALNRRGEFTKDGFIKGILHGIKDELKIPEEALEQFSIEKHLIAAYRDIVEGGKPQFLFFIHSYWTKAEIIQNFKDKVKKENKKIKRHRAEDGKKLLFIHREEISRMCILPDRMIYRRKAYSMMPSAAASLVLMIEYLKEREC